MKVNFPVGATNSTVAKVAGSLPAGVSLKNVEVGKVKEDGKTVTYKRWFLTGTPSKAGEYPLVLQETVKYGNVSVAGTTTAFTLVVADSGLAEGTFSGLAYANGPNDNILVPGATSNRVQTVAQVQITTASGGKLSASVKIAGKSYSFTDTGYDSIKYLGPKETKPEDDPEGPYEFTGVLTQIQKVTRKSGKTSTSLTFTNRLTYTCLDLPKADPAGWTNSIGDVTIEMAALPDLKGSDAQENITYAGDVCRDNSAIKEWVAEAAKFAGYYTLALSPMAEPGDDVPHGNGYMTLTLDAKGKAKLAGATSDGTAYSASSVAATILVGANGEPMMRVPLYAFASTRLVGGWLTVRFPEGAAPKANLCDYDDPNAQVPVVDFDGTHGIVLVNGDPAVTYAGAEGGNASGYTLMTVPVGGWYDTVISLQRYYRSADYTNNTFAIDTAKAGETDFDKLRRRMQELNPGYDFDAAASADGLAVDLTENALAVEKQKLAKFVDEKGKATTSNDWSRCVNPANVSVKFTRATGIVNGTCDLWYEGWNKKHEQLKYSGCKHQGVLLMSFDESDFRSCFGTERVWTAGSLIVPQKVSYTEPGKAAKKTRTWNASFRFNIVATPAELPKE